MLTPAAFRAVFAEALAYPDYLDTARPHERAGWDAFASRVALTDQQRAVAASFARRINVLVISGTWCGDCVQQVPILAAIAGCLPASDLDGRTPGIDLRIIDRDQHRAVADHFMICGGHRVPTVIFLSEVFDFMALAGDKTLARFRRLAASQLGPVCPLPGAPVARDEVAAVTVEWLENFERVALMARLSPKLRGLHND